MRQATRSLLTGCTSPYNVLQRGWGANDANGCLVLSHDLLAWTPPTSTPLEVRMYRKELHEKIDALPYADRTPIVTEPTNAEPIDSDDEPLN